MVIDDTKIIIDNIEDFIDIPDGINHLRKEMLTLAVSGNLVPQDPKEGTAEDLYQKIQEERNQEAKKAGKKLQPLPPITVDEIPFEIPETWKWVKFGDLDEAITDGEHISPRKHIEGVPLLTAKNILDDGVTFDVKDFVTEADADRFWKRCNPEYGDLLICSRGTIGRTTTVNTNQRFVLMGSVILIKFFNEETSNYAKYYLRTYSGLSQIGLLQKGMAVNALYLKDIKTAMLPLPPLAEQKRIVEKVEDLMKIIDELETKKNERNAIRSSLTKSAFNSLGINDSTIALEHMSEIVQNLEDVSELEKGILSLAVSGNLVIQKPKDTSPIAPTELSQKRNANKDTVVGKVRFSTRIQSESPYSLPNSWRWVCLEDIAENINDGNYGASYPKKNELLDSGIPFLTSASIMPSGEIDLINSKYISSKKHAELKKAQIQPGDVIFPNRGARRGQLMGLEPFAVICPESIQTGNINPQLTRIRLSDEIISNAYLVYVLRSGYFLSQFSQAARGIALQFINLTMTKKFLIPLPPRAEQRHIVEKVDELMTLTTELKSTLNV